MIDRTWKEERREYAFRRPDGTWMRIERDSMPNAMWAEWTDEFAGATMFRTEKGYQGDHRWEDMQGDSMPVAFLVTTERRYQELGTDADLQSLRK